MEKNGRLRKEEEQDRLSSLSDELIHVIMSFLSLQDAVHTCVLSKRWEFLWRSLPYLHFDLGAYSFKNGLAAKLRSFSNFVSQILVRRRHTNLVKVGFNSRAGIGYNDVREYRVDSSLVELVICYAIQHNVQELDIRACCNKCIQFPSCFTTCELLTTLKLESVMSGVSSDEYDSDYDSELYDDDTDEDDNALPLDQEKKGNALPSAYSYNIKKLRFPALQTFHMVRCVVRDPANFYSRIFSSSPNLQNLKLINTPFNGIDSLSIRAPNLKSLEFDDAPGLHPPKFEVVVDTPKLTSFKFRGYDNNNYPIWCFPSSLPSLDQVYFVLPPNKSIGKPLLDLVNTFKMFTHVKDLTVSGHILMAFELLAVEEESQLQYPNLKYLKLLFDKKCDFSIPPNLRSRFLSNSTSLKICVQY